MKLRRVHSLRLPRLSFLLVLTPLCFALAAHAQDAPAAGDQSATAAPATEATPADNAESAAPESSSAPPPYESGVPGIGVPYSSVAQDVNLDALRTLDPFDTRLLGANVGASPRIGTAQGGVELGTAGLSTAGGTFIDRGFPPQDADLKIGPLYFKLDRLAAELLYTDNRNLSDTNHQSETLAVIELTMTMIVQLTDDLQFSVNGTLIYLPIQNIVGLDSSALAGGLGFALDAVPLLAAQVAYDTIVAGWPVRFTDQFNTATGVYSDNAGDSFNLFDGSRLEQNSNGRYTFHSGVPDERSINFNGNGTRDDSDYFSVFANTVSALTSNYLPGDVLFTARATRTDLWYNQDTRGLPSSRDDFYALAETTRPNMRFTLFASYDIDHSSDVAGVYQTFKAGLFGPINDQLFLRADAGYYISNTGNEGAVWTVDLFHDAGRYTTEEFTVSQGLSEFNDEVVTGEYYRINQILGPTLQATGFADHTTYEELGNFPASNRSQEDVGVRLSWILGPKTNLTIAGIYTHQHFDNGFLTDTWTGRISLWRTLSDTLFLTAFYQYQQSSSNQPNGGYYENLVFLSLVKYFP